MQTRSLLARLFAAPENESALAAVRELAKVLASAGSGSDPLLVLHGPSGTGKTALLEALVEDASRRATDLVLSTIAALDFPQSAEGLQEFRQSDLLIIEDVQHLPLRVAEALVQTIDARFGAGLPTVVTGNVGPGKLTHRGTKFPARLTSRLAGGLVVALETWSAASRLRFLEERARSSKLAVASDLLAWLAEQLTGGGRQLVGAVHELAALQALNRGPLRLDDVREHFSVQAAAGRPTVERILERVGGYFDVEPKQLRSARRFRRWMLPRQVSMYLARRLTPLSLEQIGACFGGRDHTTVLYACKKVEAALKSDRTLSGAVRQMHAELT